MKPYLNFLKKPKRTLIPVLSLLGLVACDESIKSNEISLSSFEEELTCESPVTLPDRSLTRFETEYYWIKDRSNLVDCKEIKELIEKFYETRDSKILEVLKDG